MTDILNQTLSSGIITDLHDKWKRFVRWERMSRNSRSSIAVYSSQCHVICSGETVKQSVLSGWTYAEEPVLRTVGSLQDNTSEVLVFWLTVFISKDIFVYYTQWCARGISQKLIFNRHPFFDDLSPLKSEIF